MITHGNTATAPLCAALLLTACASFEGSWAPTQTAQTSPAPQATPVTAPTQGQAAMAKAPQMEPIVYSAPAVMPSLAPTPKPQAAVTPSVSKPTTKASPTPSPEVSAKPGPRSFAGVRLMTTADSPLAGLDAAAELQWQLTVPEELAAQWLPASVRISVLAPDFVLPSASSACLKLPAQGLARRLSLQPQAMGEFQVGLRARLHDGEGCASTPVATLDEATVVVVESGPNVDPAPALDDGVVDAGSEGSSLPWGLLLVAAFAVAVLVLFRGRLQQWVRS